MRCAYARAAVRAHFRKKIVKTLGVSGTDFLPETLKINALFSPVWLWRKFFLCLLNARANRFSKKIVKRLGVAALFRRVRRYPGVAVSRLARLIVLP